MSLPPEVLKKVKLLEINTRKLVNNLFAGEYHTAFKGQGMTFADFREYVPGDDVRSISWPLTARTGKPYIKTFEEERELTLILAVDVSGSSDFGTGPYFKGEVMTHMAALLAFSAVKNNDQIGLLLFSDQVEHFVPPKKGRGHVHRLLRDLFYYKPKSHRTKLSSGFSYLQGILKKRATVFVFSDFMDQGFEQSLRLLGRKHDVVACVVNDAAEYSLPSMGVIEVQDAETGEIVTVDTSSQSFRAQYEEAVAKRKDARDRLLRLAQVERVDVKSSEDYVNPLVAFFKKRR
ncbi:DUF58 domain-containing protein [Bdellovibrio bacteriovorus]|uniref:DUF58 domain-containing protein n=1 Tax=Bdellovibrio bacteriovorus TaxID=959 RepID=UPI00045C1730|nr:DUF58 domain-containing protein [Bdellovibrio bacteriovorus]AHZ85287.1 hypothetical protein EP01_10105 [Bdellovibrio bacteriovorus]BEV69182.1 hypothetical protein Bb109J_c2602 [Bdellovibrio bacteriovorus]